MATSGTQTVSAGASSVTVDHTYGAEPPVVAIEPQTFLRGNSYVISKTSTQFTLTFESPLYEDFTFDWATLGTAAAAAPSANQYCTIANAIEHSGITFNQLGLADDAALTDYASRLVTKASRLIDRFCNVPDTFFYGGATVTEYKSGKEFDGVDSYPHTNRSAIFNDWRRVFMLDYAPVISVTSVAENTASSGATPSWSTIASTSYVVTSSTGKLVFAQSSEPDEGDDNLRIVYVAGYATLPSAIEMACEELVGNTLKTAVKNLLNASYRFGGRAQAIEVQPAIDFTDSVKQMIEPYKRVKM